MSKKQFPISAMFSCVSISLFPNLSLANTTDSCTLIGECQSSKDIKWLEQSLIPLPSEQTEGLLRSNYWVSEKLDGIRALWTGKYLLTRKGNQIFAPKWFTDGLPNDTVEGELWAGRGRFPFVQKTVLDRVPNNEAWSEIRFMLFELPNDSGGFKQRYRKLTQVVDTSLSQHVGLVEQAPLSSYNELFSLLEKTEELGGEGLMLQRVGEFNKSRTKPIKIKKHIDSEGKVIDYKNGKGKYKGLVGALVLQLADGRLISIGSGLSDQMRENPPALGEMVTFRYNGYTSTGLPRFARFLRVRRPE